jgi:diaminohydroxyphosphoribosylaminopyrimidine deaminase/5-amino-6-(5-phosphoribosylamino)uracil reductase
MLSPMSHKDWDLTLALAGQAVGLTDPNPRVGCVIVAADGATVLGQGHTQAAGGPHAEVMALRDAQARGHDVRGATVYVSLEPCAHHGRTPPCCDALVAAGVGRVEIACGDPNPLVNGQGTARIAAAGIAIGHAPADVAQRARELNIGFFSRMQRGRPWMRMKVAASLDGRTALPNGASQWITGPRRAPTATPGASARAPCSRASAPCWPTTRRWTCVSSRPSCNPCAASSTRAWTPRPARACSNRPRR